MSYSSDAIARMAGVVKSFWDRDRSMHRFREVSDADIAHLKRQYAYVQMVGEVDADFVPDPNDQMTDLNTGMHGEPVEIEMKTGWTLMYWPPTEEYPAAMSSSPGRQIFRPGTEGSDSDVQGTIAQQTAVTACEMMAMAKMLGWKNVHIVDGLPEMSRVVWAVSQASGLECAGYEPGPGDQHWCERNADLLQQYAKQPAASLVASPGAGGGGGEEIE